MDESNDPAAVFACALSLHTACLEAAKKDPAVNLSEAYNGADQFMREVMRVANLFEDWACGHVAFEKLGDVWPYILEDRFGSACLEVMMPGFLMEFDADDCLRVASCLRLPLWIDGSLAIPFLLDVENPVSGSAFERYRIQTVRNDLNTDGVLPFVTGDETVDDNFGPPYFVIYGVRRDGALEHIAERGTYHEAADLLRAMFPDLDIPENPVSG